MLKIFDVNGREVFSARKDSPSGAGGSGGYFTQDVDVSNLASGMYLVNLITEKETLSTKFVKEK